MSFPKLSVFLACLFLFFSVVFSSLAVTAGPNDPGTMGSIDGTGNVNWTDPDNAKTSNNSYATYSSGSGDRSDLLRATNFAFALSSGSTIDAITVKDEKKRTGSAFCETGTVNLVLSGAIRGEDSTADDPDNADWPTVDTIATYNGITNALWNTTWSEAQVEDSTFGVQLDAICDIGGTGNVDHINITITYTEEIPEFSTYALILLIAGIGYVVYLKKDFLFNNT